MATIARMVKRNHRLTSGGGVAGLPGGFLDSSLIIAGGGLATVAVATLALRQHRETKGLRMLAERRGWKYEKGVAEAWRARLSGSALMQIGHSRHMQVAFRTPEGNWLFAYVYETGFEYRRATHSWRVVVRGFGPRLGRATLTRQRWLIDAATTPTSHDIVLCREDEDQSVPLPRLTAVVEDHDAWCERLRPDLKAWLQQQPEERSWEIAGGLIVGHEPGGIREIELAALSASACRLAALLGDDPSH
jgi:hypothetical protein